MVLGKERKFIWVVKGSFGKCKGDQNNKREQGRRARELEQRGWENYGAFWSVFGSFWSWKLKNQVVRLEE
jgi:hypothetical protein